MYRQDFRHEILTLQWRGEVLAWPELDERLLRDSEGNTYKTPIKFSFEEDGVEKTVEGWVGVLRDGSRSWAGFSILHSNRVIKGWPDSWRPTTIFGQEQGSNDLVNQRLLGEVHLNDFEVTHTKDNIQWFGDQEERVEQGLRDASREYIEAAKSFRRSTDDQRGPTDVQTDAAVARFLEELSSPELLDVVKAPSLMPKALVEDVVSSIKRSVVEQYPERLISQVNGLTVKVWVEDNLSANDP